jgi:hypothetical protein
MALRLEDELEPVESAHRRKREDPSEYGREASGLLSLLVGRWMCGKYVAISFCNCFFFFFFSQLSPLFLDICYWYLGKQLYCLVLTLGMVSPKWTSERPWRY